MILAIRGGDRGLRLGVAAHFHEPEALAAARVTVADDLRALHAAVCGEDLLQRRAIDIVAQISDIQLTAHKILLIEIGRLTCGFTFLVSAEKRPKSGPGR